MENLISSAGCIAHVSQPSHRGIKIFVHKLSTKCHLSLGLG